jgi:hypothetical protein
LGRSNLEEKQPYEKPQMITEKVDVATFLASGTGVTEGPIQVLQPFFGLCCN